MKFPNECLLMPKQKKILKFWKKSFATEFSILRKFKKKLDFINKCKTLKKRDIKKTTLNLLASLSKIDVWSLAALYDAKNYID